MANPYSKSVRHLDEIDIYQIGNLYEVNSHAVFHALKKLLCAGKRGAKDYEQDLMEAIESIERELQIIGMEEVKVPSEKTARAIKEAESGNSPSFDNMDDMMDSLNSDFDEQRIDVIGQNGNEGEHYEPALTLTQVLKAMCPIPMARDWTYQVDWSKSSPHHQFAYQDARGEIVFCMHQPMGYDFIGRPVAQ